MSSEADLLKLAARYSCQEHGKDYQRDCVACECASDIAMFAGRIKELETHLESLQNRYAQSAIPPELVKELEFHVGNMSDSNFPAWSVVGDLMARLLDHIQGVSSE